MRGSVGGAAPPLQPASLRSRLFARAGAGGGASLSPPRRCSALVLAGCVWALLLAGLFAGPGRPGLALLRGGCTVLARGAAPRGASAAALFAAAGVGWCATTWPGLERADSPADAHCPWLSGWPAVPDDARSGIDVSLTTFAGRWAASPELLLGALWSLLNQTAPPDAIWVHIPVASRAGGVTAGGVPTGHTPFPPSAAALLSSIPRVRVVWTRVDYGPATKFLPYLAHPEVAARGAAVRAAVAAGGGNTAPLPTPLPVVFVCDDDRRYPADLLATLAGWARRPEHYGRAVVGTWGVAGPGHDAGFGTGAVTAADVAARAGAGGTPPQPQRVELLLGTTGYMMAPGTLDPAPFYNAPPAWRTVFAAEDDNWLGCVAQRQRVPLLVVPEPFRPGAQFGGQSGCTLDGGACLHYQPGNGARYETATRLQRSGACDADWCAPGSGAVCEPMYGGGGEGG